MKIRNFTHYETYKDGVFSSLDLHVVTDDGVRHRIEGVTTCSCDAQSGQKMTDRHRSEIFAFLGGAKRMGFNVKIIPGEPQMFRTDLTIEVEDYGTFYFNGVAK